MEKPVVQVVVGDRVIFRYEYNRWPYHTEDALEILQAKYHLEEATKSFDKALLSYGIGLNDLALPQPDQPEAG